MLATFWPFCNACNAPCTALPLPIWLAAAAGVESSPPFLVDLKSAGVLGSPPSCISVPPGVTGPPPFFNDKSVWVLGPRPRVTGSPPFSIMTSGTETCTHKKPTLLSATHRPGVSGSVIPCNVLKRIEFGGGVTVRFWGGEGLGMIKFWGLWVDRVAVAVFSSPAHLFWPCDV